MNNLILLLCIILVFFLVYINFYYKKKYITEDFNNFMKKDALSATIQEINRQIEMEANKDSNKENLENNNLVTPDIKQQMGKNATVNTKVTSVKSEISRENNLESDFKVLKSKENKDLESKPIYTNDNHKNLNESIDKNDMIFNIKKIDNDWTKFLERVNIKKPSIASILEGSKPLKINNFIIEIKIISNHDFHLEMLNNNADSIRSILKEIFELKLDFVIIKGDENIEEKEKIDEDFNGSQNDHNKDIQDKIVDLFDGEIIN